MILGYYLSKPISTAVGFLYPAYCSFKAIKSPEPEDDRQWLTYWVIYALFIAFEYLADTLIFWTPFYYEAKILFILWLQHPSTQGADKCFLALQDWMDKNNMEDKIDSAAGRVRERLSESGGRLLTPTREEPSNKDD